ncbi:MAG: DUF4097 domain-containing protein [Butyrivibrio sp.]|nr:DUF4097 domain-containing protein [Acetatifactor muris]MCM1559344.1 DUF4097 domain-containing protein [Butyrivibrio sp.]
MKNTKIALIAILCVIILGLCVLLGYGISGRFGRAGSVSWGGRYQLVQEQEIPLKDVEDIRIEYTKSGNDVAVYEAEGDTVIIREYANYEAAGRELAQIKLQSGKLTVKGPRRTNSFISINRDIYTEIYLPAGYSGRLNIGTVSGEISLSMDLTLEGELNLASISGDINTYSQNIKAKKINAASTSGEIRLSLLETEEVNVSTTSGDIWIEKADAPVSCASTSGEITVSGGTGNRDVDSTSGDIWVKELSGRISVDTTSGEINVSGDSGYGSMGSTSGDVFLSLAELSGDISVSTSSGEVTMELPKEASLEFEAGTSSGEIDTFFDDALSFSRKGNHAEGTVGSGGLKIEIITTSGDVRIKAR